MLALIFSFFTMPASAQDDPLGDLLQAVEDQPTAPAEGDLNMESMPEPSGMPDLYVIQPGDTLWNLATAFLGDPEAWPELWAINDYITNPHWIYPGNQIVFTLGTLLEPPTIELETDDRGGYVVQNQYFEATEANCGPAVRFDFPQETGIFTVPGFIEDSETLPILGKVARSPRNQSFMVEKDVLYLKMNDPDLYECGDVLTIFRKIKNNVKKEEGRFQSYGSLYKTVGEVRVVHHFGDYVVGSIRTSFSEIARGDLIGDVNPAVVQIDVSVPNGDLQGKIIEQLSQNHIMNTTRSTVFIDRGSNDGVEEGDTFYVIRQKDEFISGEEDPDLPPFVVGRILVVHVAEDHSVAVVTDAAQGINIGDRVSMEVQ